MSAAFALLVLLLCLDRAARGVISFVPDVLEAVQLPPAGSSLPGALPGQTRTSFSFEKDMPHTTDGHAAPSGAAGCTKTPPEAAFEAEAGACVHVLCRPLVSHAPWCPGGTEGMEEGEEEAMGDEDYKEDEQGHTHEADEQEVPMGEEEWQAWASCSCHVCSCCPQ